MGGARAEGDSCQSRAGAGLNARQERRRRGVRKVFRARRRNELGPFECWLYGLRHCLSQEGKERFAGSRARAGVELPHPPGCRKADCCANCRHRRETGTVYFFCVPFRIHVPGGNLCNAYKRDGE